jgi:imidazole glycerol phosphate synthase glutamine amidotransferase subunit
LIRALDERGLRVPLREALGGGVPFLGICLGLQALFNSSEEAPGLSGLQCFQGNVQGLPDTMKLPHMGWNQLRIVQQSQLLEGIPANAYFYFAHSYAVSLENCTIQITKATCNHGTDFTAVLEHKNIFAVQFHPEKSGTPGSRVLGNFIRLAA